jgi:hypothetical protein
MIPAEWIPDSFCPNFVRLSHREAMHDKEFGLWTTQPAVGPAPDAFDHRFCPKQETAPAILPP